MVVGVRGLQHVSLWLVSAQSLFKKHNSLSSEVLMYIILYLRHRLLNLNYVLYNAASAPVTHIHYRNVLVLEPLTEGVIRHNYAIC